MVDERASFRKDRTYIFSVHPHGVFAWHNPFFFCTGLTNNELHANFPWLAKRIASGAGLFRRKPASSLAHSYSPSPRLASILFRIPVIREVACLFGGVDASRKSLTAWYVAEQRYIG